MEYLKINIYTMPMSNHESGLVPANIIELNTRMMELNGLQVRVKSRVSLSACAVEISLGEEKVIEVLTASRLGLELFGQDVYPAAIIYTDGVVRGKIPSAFNVMSNGMDQLNLSADATYLAWTTVASADDPHLKHDSQGRPFRHHLVTTMTMAEIRRELGSEGNDLIKLVNNPFATALRNRSNGDWDPKNIG